MNHPMKPASIYKFLLPVLFFFIPFCSHALGVLTHEAIVDAAWDKTILPLLKQKYPGASAEEIKDAHAYAYGGAVAPDMGYYPRGNKLFTNLVHYVRSGDMVMALLKNANNLNQYAFAMGFLSHYHADNYGHPLATNRCVPLVYPKLQKKYGSYITYAQNEISHMRMEFGFDVLEVAKGNYASQAYRNFIGFKVDTTVLAKAFLETYGININELYKNHLSRSVETFRWIVANVFPLITRQAWAAKKNSILQKDSTATAARFNYKMRQRIYNKEYGRGYKQPGFFPTLLSFFIRVLPKVGPLKALKFKAPTTEAEKYFAQSFDSIMHYYILDIKKQDSKNITLQDIDFDTGKPTAPCEYSLADDTYRQLLLKHKTDNFKNISYPLQQNMLGFFKTADASGDNIKASKKCAVFYRALNDLKAMQVVK